MSPDEHEASRSNARDQETLHSPAEALRLGKSESRASCIEGVLCGACSLFDRVLGRVDDFIRVGSGGELGGASVA